MGFHPMISLLVFTILQINNAVSNAEESQTYIIHMDRFHKPKSFATHEAWHRSTLTSLMSSSSLEDQENEMLLYSYNHVMHGFSARLTASQLSELEKSPAHIATYPESFGKLFTTHSSKFLGLRQNSGLLLASSSGQDVIIGIIDTGVWPESESFSDRGMSEVPKRWKGACENGPDFSPSLCNNKLIGARSFSKGLEAAGIKISTKDDFDSPRDWFGHGTHTSSTAAGNYVLGASHFGYAKGTARGVAPRAHVAMYKVLWATDSEQSAASDVLAGMDQAISDGVDIMSLSLGFESLPYFNDVIAIASLSAIEKGIVVVCAAGNDGAYSSIHNGAPWITTVGAGTLDRTFTATLTLDNGLTVEGISYFPESVYITDAPLYYGKDNANKAICNYGALDHKEVKGKVVLCDNTTETDVEGQKEEVQRAGGYAGIFMTDLSLLDPEDFSIPAIIVPFATGALIREYATQANTTRVKTLSFVHTKLGTKPSPEVAYFSSRGPDPVTPSILKPDVLAPGVDVLAAVAPNKPCMRVNNYDLVTDYELYSGTSMAAPHVAGVAALLKAVHREWSPAAIRSAIMTTAYSTGKNSQTTILNQWSGLPATPLDFGAGHINPNKAMNPGLIYDMDLQDYVEFLCGLGYNAKQMKAVIRRSHWYCSSKPADLNYPSFMAIFNGTDSPKAKTFSRVVTNVGDETSTYRAYLEVPKGMRITVEPSTLVFTGKNQEQGFSLSVEVDSDVPKVIYGYLGWIDQYNHIVSSPVVAIS
ncbi:hypothetical protein ACLB2K_014908 [Fragaria x ananassa]